MKLWVILLIMTFTSFAGEIPLLIPEISSVKDASSLSGECSFSEHDNKRITCKFFQVNLRRPEMDSAKQVAQAFTEISSLTRKELEKTVVAACSTVNEALKSAKKGSPKEAYLNDVKLACLEKDLAVKAQKMSISNIISEKGKCRVSHNEFEMEFKKMGKHKWVSDSSPKGVCDISTVATLESKNGYAWKYTQVRMGVGNDSLEFCKMYEIGKPIIYSWDAESEFSLDGCKSIVFGGL